MNAGKQTVGEQKSRLTADFKEHRRNKDQYCRSTASTRAAASWAGFVHVCVASFFCAQSAQSLSLSCIKYVLFQRRPRRTMRRWCVCCMLQGQKGECRGSEKERRGEGREGCKAATEPPCARAEDTAPRSHAGWASRAAYATQPRAARGVRLRLTCSAAVPGLRSVGAPTRCWRPSRRQGRRRGRRPAASCPGPGRRRRRRRPSGP